MINGFEKLTAELTQKEINCIYFIVRGLNKKIGREKAVTNERICKGVQYHLGFKITPARMRKIIHYIRINKMVVNLIATSEGYYVATCKEEVIDYIESLTQRIKSIESIRGSFELSLF